MDYLKKTFPQSKNLLIEPKIAQLEKAAKVPWMA
jgi:hypothetical protein